MVEFSIPRTRPALEARADRLVTENRATIALVFPAVGAVLLVASAEGLLPPPLAFNPLLVLLGILVMRSPLVVGVLPTVTRRGGIAVSALCAYAYGIEYVGIHTGFPYGTFSYGVDLGPMVGGVPLALPVFFLPLVMNAYLLTALLLGDRARRARLRLPAVIAAVVVMDLVLDPGAVALGFWTYADGGAFYGVPWSNFLGWVGSATVAVVGLDWGFDRRALLARLDSCPFMLDDMVSFVVLWGSINLWFGHVVPACLAVAFGVGLVRTERFDAGLFRTARLRRQ